MRSLKLAEDSVRETVPAGSVCFAVVLANYLSGIRCAVRLNQHFLFFILFFALFPDSLV